MPSSASTRSSRRTHASWIRCWSLPVLGAGAYLVIPDIVQHPGRGAHLAVQAALQCQDQAHRRPLGVTHLGDSFRGAVRSYWKKKNIMNKYTPPESIRLLLEKHPAIFRFRRALRRADQVALDHILALACGSAPGDDPGSYPLVEQILLGMILAEQKELRQVARVLERAPAAKDLPAAEELPAAKELPAAERLPAAGLTCHSSAPSVPPAA